MTHAGTPSAAHARREDALHEVIVEAGREGRRLDLTRARAFAPFAASCAFAFHGCASIEEYGRRHGYGARQTREYVAAGRVLALCPEAERLVLDGSLTISTLAIVEPYFTDPAFRPTADDGEALPLERILTWARARSDRDLRRAVHRKREEVRRGRHTVGRELHLTAQGADDLDRAQILASRKKQRYVSPSETVEIALRQYVETHDPLETSPGTRRLPPMPRRDDGGRHPRSVPAEVKRALMSRHGDVCAIEHCPHRIWLQNSHHHPHALGGGNELADQDRLCTGHHDLKDRGEITWTPDESEPGGGYYVTRDGEILRLKPLAPDPRETGPPPDGGGGEADRVCEARTRLRASRGPRPGGRNLPWTGLRVSVR